VCIIDIFGIFKGVKVLGFVWNLRFWLGIGLLMLKHILIIII